MRKLSLAYQKMPKVLLTGVRLGKVVRCDNVEMVLALPILSTVESKTEVEGR
jgi:hypothetical protein